MAATIWKGHLTFGLVSVPVRLHAAAREEHISFNMLHEKCGSRIKQQLYCPVCEKVIERKDTVKGHEIGDGRYVIVEPEDLEKIEPPSSKTIDVQEFVKMEDVDPIYFNTSYYLVPEGAGTKAYYLLLRVLEDSKYVGIARIVMHQREHVVVVRPGMGGIMLHTIYYENEIRKVEDFGEDRDVSIGKKELEMGEMFIKSLSAKFEPDKYFDQYQKNVETLLAAKARGKSVTAPEQPTVAPVMDLMAALKASLEKGGKTMPRQPVGAVEPIDIEEARSKKTASKETSKEKEGKPRKRKAG